MDPPDSTFVQRFVEQVRGSFVEHVGWIFWTWVFGFGGTLVKYFRAKQSGLSPEAMNQWLGASVALALMVVATGVIVWSIWAFGILVLVTAIVIAARLIIGRSSTERERLSRHRKGLLDHERDRDRLITLVMKTMDRITKEHNRLALMANQVRGELEKGKGRFASHRFSKHSRSSAKYIAREARRLKNYSSGFFAAIKGVIDWNKETNKIELLQEDKLAIQNLKVHLDEHMAVHAAFRQSVLEVPNLSQEVNAAKSDLAESITAYMDATKVALDFCDVALQELTDIEVTPPSPPPAS